MLCRKGLPGCCSDLSIHYNNSVHLTFNVTIWPLFPQSASFPIAIGKPSSVTVYPRVSLGLPRSPIRLPRDAAVPPTHSLFPYKHISSKPFHGTQAPWWVFWPYSEPFNPFPSPSVEILAFPPHLSRAISFSMPLKTS